VTIFREALDEISPYVVAGWAASPQPELGDERRPIGSESR
jgi:hypothetical protein